MRAMAIYSASVTSWYPKRLVYATGVAEASRRNPEWGA